jgi:hypothetical protein
LFSGSSTASARIFKLSMYIDYWGSTSIKCLCEEEFENVD